MGVLSPHTQTLLNPPWKGCCIYKIIFSQNSLKANSKLHIFQKAWRYLWTTKEKNLHIFPILYLLFFIFPTFHQFYHFFIAFFPTYFSLHISTTNYKSWREIYEKKCTNFILRFVCSKQCSNIFSINSPSISINVLLSQTLSKIHFNYFFCLLFYVNIFPPAFSTNTRHMLFFFLGKNLY